MPAMKSASAGSGIERVDRRRHLGGNAGQELDHRPGALAQQVDAGLDLRSHDLRDADLLDPRGEEGKAGDIFDDAEAAHALTDRMMGAVGRGDVANDSRDRSDRMQVLGARIFDSRVGLQQDADHALGADGFLGSGDRRRPADGHGQHHSREQHRLAYRQNGQAIRGKRRNGRALAWRILDGRVGHVPFLEIRAASSG